MQKSIYGDANVQDRGFTKHIHHVLVDLGVYPNDPTARLVELYKVILRENGFSTGTAGGKPRNIELYRKALGPMQDPSTGVWIKIGDWEEGKDYTDSSASGSVSVDPLNGDVHVVMVFGTLVNGVLRFQSWEETVKRATFAPAIVRVPAPSTGVDHSAAVAALQRASEAHALAIAGIELALGNISQEPSTLDAKDRAALDWLAALRQLFRY